MSNINKAQVNGTNRTKSTISFWIKRGTLGADQKIFSFVHGGAEYLMKFKSNDQINIYSYNGSSYVGRIETNRKFRDPFAWYHFHIQVDTTDATAENRFRFYVNGEQVTSLLNSNTPSQNDNFELSTSNHHLYIGSQSDGGDAFAGSFAHFNYTDGYSYAPTVFGETDSSTGEWKINTSPSVTYGTNGFFLKFENSGNLDLDSSGNNLTFTTTGTITQTQDNPSNVFATMNPLDNYFFDGTFINGNNTVQSGNSSYAYCSSTIHVSSGKYYWEIKADTPHSSMRVGIGSKMATSTSDNLGNDTDGEAVIYPSGSIKVDNVDNPNSWSGTSWTTGDILGFALDLDNNKLYISKNGTFMNSGDPTSGSTGTGAISIIAPSNTPTGAYFVAWGDNSSSGSATMSHNFGNGFFGTTAISSEGTNASNIGKFEYDVPTGYTALSTKGLNE